MQTETLGLAVYHRRDIPADPDSIDSLMAITGELLSAGHLGFVDARLSESDRFARQRKLTDANLRQLKADVSGGMVAEFSISDRSRVQQEADGRYAMLHASVTAARNRKMNSDLTPRCPYLLYILLPREVANEHRLATALRELVERLDAEYAFIHVAADFRDALMEVTVTPMFPWGHQLTSREERTKARLLKCQSARMHIGELACGAYWGNFWGPGIVEKLGGLERVMDAVPAAVVSEEQKNGVYVQLTREIPVASSQEYLSALDSLEAYTAPASVSSLSGPAFT